MTARPQPRCAVIGVVGRASVGKSTLVNRLVGEKISIVSPVPQTTRNTIRGVLTDRRGQLVLVDTPGLHKSESPLGTLMNRMARHAAANADALLLVFDGSHPPAIEDDGWMRRALFAEQPVVCFVNQCDRDGFDAARYEALWHRVEQEKGTARAVRWIPGSACRGDNLPALADALFGLAAPAPALLFPPDTVTDYPRRLAIADVVREKLFDKLQQELPHEVGVRVDEIREQGRAWRAEVSILVARPSQKPIVIGPKGRTLRHVKRAAGPEIGAMFDADVELALWVRVEKDWPRNFWLLRQMGYAGER